MFLERSPFSLLLCVQEACSACGRMGKKPLGHKVDELATENSLLFLTSVLHLVCAAQNLMQICLDTLHQPVLTLPLPANQNKFGWSQKYGQYTCF